MMVLGGGFALSCLLTVLPWPYLRPQVINFFVFFSNFLNLGKRFEMGR